MLRCVTIRVAAFLQRAPVRSRLAEPKAKGVVRAQRKIPDAGTQLHRTVVEYAADNEIYVLSRCANARIRESDSHCIVAFHDYPSHLCQR